MPKPKTMNDIAPPPRRPSSTPATNAVPEGALIPISTRLTKENDDYLRMLSARTRQTRQDLINRAIALLRTEAGEA